MNYTETFITEVTIEEVCNEMEAEPLYFNDEWLDEDDNILDIVSDEWLDWEPDEEFWAYLDELEDDPDFLPDADEVSFNPYEGCYDYDC